MQLSLNTASNTTHVYQQSKISLKSDHHIKNGLFSVHVEKKSCLYIFELCTRCVKLYGRMYNIIH